MIVATEGIDEEVIEYLANTRIDTDFVNKLDDLPSKLGEICSKQNEQTLNQLLSEVSWDTMISQALLSSFGLESPLLPDDLASYRFTSRTGLRALSE